MSVLLDTSVVIDVLRAHGPAIDFSKSLAATPTCSEITRVEVIRGLRSAERTTADRLFRTLGWAILDEPIARRAGELGRIFRRSHTGLSSADLVIAATAQELELDLATLNLKHFPMFEGLEPPYEP